MRMPLFRLLRVVRFSYWFLPAVMVVLAILLGVVAIWLDSGPASGLLDLLGWYQKSKPEGARAVLSAIAGSMITVAGVVFSITIVAIAYAATQYGPRILTNFMSDRGNQVTLGTFIGTFVYCIAVLRTIYSGDSAYVPQLAVMIALVLALCSIAVLIYFIHHVPESIHINNVVAHIGRQLLRAIDKQFPACFGDPPELPAEERERLARDAERAIAKAAEVREICADSDGYIEAIDDGHLLSAACQFDLLVSLRRSPGEFVYTGRPLVAASPRERVTDEAIESLLRSYSIGSNRTPGQDIFFLVDELVEIGARALSPGVNDPYSAMTCVDWLSAGAAELARRAAPSPYRLDEDGRLRVIAPAASFAAHIDRGFGRMRAYLAQDVNATSHALRTLESLAEQCRSLDQLKALSDEADRLISLARTKLQGPSLERLDAQAAESRAAFDQALARCDGQGAD